MARYTLNYDADEGLWEITDTKNWQAVAKGGDKASIEAELRKLNNEYDTPDEYFEDLLDEFINEYTEEIK